MKFTRAADIAALLPADKAADVVIWDATLPGFGLRARGTAQRWIIQYRNSAGAQRRESLGSPDRVSLTAARAVARQRFAQLELGIDPSAARARARAEASATKQTLAHVAALYLDARKDKLRPATLRAARWHFNGLWAPLRDKPIKDIGRADIAARLGEIVKANGRVSAARARGSLSAMYYWAAREGLCEGINPVSLTNDPNEGAKPRERTLADPELAAVWRACGGNSDFERIVRLLILTGCRRAEVGGLRWSEVDIDSGALCIPGERTKSGHPLELTLPEIALGILRGVERRPNNDHAFGTTARGFTAWSYSLAVLNARVAANEGKPLAAWTLHDLRRTMRTGLGRLGVRPDVAERCVGHLVAGAVARVYDKFKYQPEITTALQSWANHVTGVIEGWEDNVIPMRG